MPEEQAPITPHPPHLFEESVLASLKIERQQWEETTVQPPTHRMPERKHLMTTSGVSINRVYTPQDNAALDYRCDLNLPGEYPYSYEKSRQLSHELICPHSSRSATPVYETTD